MHSNELPHEPDTGDRNVERLLATAYQPEAPDADFVKSLEAQLCVTARDLAARAAHAGPAPAEDVRLRAVRRRLGWAMGLAAAMAVVALGLHAANRRPADAPPLTADNRGSAQSAPATPASFGNLVGDKGLTPRPRPAAAPVEPLAVGATLTTRAGERRRVTLADGSLIYLNQNTTLTQVAPRRLALAAGQVYVEVAPREAGSPFTVKTPTREVSALGTHFAVQAEPAGTGVVVTQGTVKVTGADGVLRAGQQLAPGARTPSPAPRASHVLDWTRDLMAAAESPLVPCSKHAGGALIALDPNGQEVHLALRKYHIDVHIEDGFARTTIDQTYFNHELSRLEGTFYFPLPPDAALSRLAMYVEENGSCRLMEGGMAERDHARQVYETIRYTQRDPALLEWVDGSTFKMRVFPLEGRKEKRILLSYTQRLPTLYGATRYRFPSGHSMELVGDWSFEARVKHGGNLRCTSESHPNMAIKPRGADMVLRATAKNIKPDRDVTVEIYDNDAAREGVARFSGCAHENAQYLMLRYRPELVSPPQRQRRDWVFLFEASANRDPLLARAQIDVIRTLLVNAEHDDTFAVLTAGTRVHAFADKARPCAPENMDAAVKFLEGTHLIGALDLGQALDAAAPFLKAAQNPHLVHVGAGIAALGERQEDVLAKHLPEGTRYVGVGVGKRWNRSFMKLAADRTGGYFTQINPDEPIAWRAFELLATLNTPRLMELRVVDNEEHVRFLTDASSVAQGEEVCALARVRVQARKLPTRVTVTGKVDGKPFVRELAVRDVAPDAGYLPRQWAKLEIDRLLADGAEQNKQRVIELSKAMYVMSPFTSLLVLETDADYERFKVDRGRKDHWAMYACPDRIPVVYEPPSAWAGNVAKPAPRKDRKPSVDEVLQTIVIRVPARISQSANRPGGNSSPYLLASQLYSGAAAVPEEEFGIEIGLQTPVVLQRGVDPWAGRLLDALRKTPVVRPLRTTARGPVAAGVAHFQTHSVPGGNAEVVAGSLQETYKSSGSLRIQAISKDQIMVHGSPELQMKIAADLRAINTTRSALTQTRLTYYQLLRPEVGTDPMLVQQTLEAIRGRSVANDSQPAMPGFTPFGTGGFGGGFAGRGSPGGGFGGGLPGGGFGRGFPGGGLTPGGFTAWDDSGDMKRRGDVSAPESSHVRGPRVPVTVRRLEQLGVIVRAGNDPRDIEEVARIVEHIKRLPALDRRSLLYKKAVFTGDARIFGDLAAYAPGMNTTATDILAVLEAEAKADGSAAPGKIDPAARALIAKAREAGWQTIAGSQTDAAAGFKMVCNGAGQYVYERALSVGLRESVICDGTTVLHLYPDLGIGARRTVSRFHRAELADAIPWVLPPAEDLARGADLVCVDKTTVAIVPREEKAADGKAVVSWQAHLLFAPDGRLAERQLVQMPDKKVLFRETYDASGLVRQLDPATGKVLAEQKLRLTPATAPNLKPDVSRLVVLPMPLRTREHVIQAHDLKPDGPWGNFDADAALALFATDWANRNGEAAQVFGERFHAKGDRRIGFYTLLADSGNIIVPGVFYDWHGVRVGFDIAAEHPGEPLAKYLVHHNDQQRGGAAKEVGDLGGPRDGFIQQLAAFRDLWTRWHTNQASQGDATAKKAQQNQALAYVRGCKVPLFAWAILGELYRNGGFAKDAATFRAIADGYQTLKDTPGLGFAARYEQARCLLEAGDRAPARKVFGELYTEMLKAGVLPPLDASFRQAFSDAGGSALPFAQWMRKVADDLAKDRRPAAVLLLAWQTHQLGDQPLADELLGKALAAAAPAERLPLTLVGIEFLGQTGQVARADVLLQPLLTDAKLAENLSLWRLAAAITQRRGMLARSAAYLEKALDLEYRQLPDVVNLEAVRSDYGSLLEHYQKLASAVTILETAPPQDFLARIVRAADRWRSLDNDSTAACQAAARILQKLGAKDLAWEYLTTPVGQKPNEAAPWVSLAQTLQGERDFDLADRAYAAAFAAEATNAQILWDRAHNLQQAGRVAEAREVYRRLAEGTWQPRFQALQQQARSYLGQ
jgi:ferric-dicitrate binding protein FerR (iron transport regulator)/tetratricopeptide (TPR) repeat protein